MIAPTAVLCAWLLFAGTHLLFGMPPLRGQLVARFGEQRFVALFSAVAALTLGLLAAAVAVFGGEGPAGPALGRFLLARALLQVLAFLGLALAIAGLMNYMRSPMALFRTKLHSPAGIERITRHAFFMGLTLFAVAHALLAPTLALCIYFAGFAVLSTAGALLQDRKLLIKHGAAYADYLAATSVVPFVALLQRRQALVSGEHLLRRAALSGAFALLLLAAHPLWSAFHGAPFAGVIAVGGIFASLRRWWYSNRVTAMSTSSSATGK